MPLSGLTPRSDSARIRNMLDEIEDALAKGASREDVWKTLQAEHGLTVSFDGFCKALQRARARRAASDTPKSAPSKQPQASGKNIKAEDAQPDRAPTLEENSEVVKPSSAKDKIRTSKDFKHVREMDFSELDDKYK